VEVPAWLLQAVVSSSVDGAPWSSVADPRLVWWSGGCAPSERHVLVNVVGIQKDLIVVFEHDCNFFLYSRHFYKNLDQYRQLFYRKKNEAMRQAATTQRGLAKQT
jgi:hypothetical protein